MNYEYRKGVGWIPAPKNEKPFQVTLSDGTIIDIYFVSESNGTRLYRDNDGIMYSLTYSLT